MDTGSGSGTQAAGVIAGSRAAPGGCTGFAPDARIVPVRVTAPGDLISQAEKLIQHGMELVAEMKTAVHGIRASENDPAMFPPDKFTNEFLTNYHKSKDVLDSAGKQGQYLTDLGQIAADAMWNYVGQDFENAAAVSSDGTT